MPAKTVHGCSLKLEAADSLSTGLIWTIDVLYTEWAKSLLNFRKYACNVCHVPSKCYHLAKWQKWQSDYVL